MDTLYIILFHIKSNTKDDVIRAAFRPFEHAYWSIGSRFTINEETTDQLGTWNRDGWWVDGQMDRYGNDIIITLGQ